MRDKKGFTLIELLVTIALILSILGIAIVSFINVSNRKKDEAYKLVKEQIIEAAEQYIDSNEYLFEGLSDGAYGIITVGKLVDVDYLNKVTDPRNSKSINYCNRVKITKKNGIYELAYQETNSKNCPDTINSVIVSEPGAPKVTISLDGTEGNNDWYKSNVNLKAEINTNKNGAIRSVERCFVEGDDSCTNFSSKSEIKKEYEETITDTKQITIGYRATNISGKTSIDWKTLKVDTKAPICSYEIDKQVASTGWYNKITGKPTLTFNGADELSGINGTSSYKPTIKTGSHDYKYTFKDNAGNKNDKCSVTIKYDNTNPTCSVTLSGTITNKKQSYWYTSDVKLNGQCSDNLSGCKEKAVSNTFSKNGNYKKASAGTVSDKAGNTNKCTYDTNFGIDKDVPKIALAKNDDTYEYTSILSEHGTAEYKKANNKHKNQIFYSGAAPKGKFNGETIKITCGLSGCADYKVKGCAKNENGTWQQKNYSSTMLQTECNNNKNCIKNPNNDKDTTKNYFKYKVYACSYAGLCSDKGAKAFIVEQFYEGNDGNHGGCGFYNE